MKRISLVLAFAVCLVFGASSFASRFPRGSVGLPPAVGWSTLKVGAGGFITGYKTSNDGTTRVIRTDTYGGYVWNSAASKWNQLLTATGMPSQASPSNGTYIYEVVVAPNTATRLYMWWKGQVYRSDDRGVSWTVKSAYNGGVTAYDSIILIGDSSSYNSRLFGEKMAVDPAQADTVISGSYVDGLSYSTDGGTTWNSLNSQVPLSSVNGYQINNAGGYSIGTTSIAVDTGTVGIPSGTQFYFGTKFYQTTSALASGSGTVSISPALSASVADNQILQNASGYSIAFDPNSATTCGASSNRTCGIYITSYGNGVYHSTDGGSTFSKVTGGTGGSTTFKHIVIASDGVVYTLDNSPTSVIQKYTGGAWSDVSAGNGQDALAVDPNNPARIVGVGGGFIFTSLNRGGSWVLTAGANWSPNCLTPIQPAQKRAATDIPWLAWTQECVISAADIHFDPVLPGTTSRLWFTSGIGVWYYDFGSTTAAPTTQITWNSQSAGIEQLVANWIVSPPGGKPTVYSWDRPVFYINDPTVYPSTHGPNAAVPINAGWSASYSPSTPTTLAAILNYFGSVEYSGISLDGGQTWTPFATVPSAVTSGKVSGSIAINAGSSIATSNVLWCPNSNSPPSYTTNGGGSWTDINLSGVPTGGAENGWGFAYYTDHQACAADQVNAGEFYMFNYGPAGAPSVAGIYRSKDSGATWTQIYTSSFPGGGTNDKLRAVPGYAGHLFYTAGSQGSPAGSAASGSLYRSTNADSATAGTQTWQAITRVAGVSAFGFGKIKSGGDYPTVFISGFVDGVFGIWRGDGTAAQWAAGSGTGTGVTWTNLGANPLGSFDMVKAVEGDANTYGVVYVGWSGSGYGYYTP